MAVIHAKKLLELSQAANPKQAIQKAVGDLSGVDIFFNQILVGVYIQHNKTAGGVYLPENTLKESVWQGVVGLVLKKGPMAFVDDDTISFLGQNVEIGDWIVYRAGDALNITVNETSCRLVQDRLVKMRINDPAMVL